MQTKQIKRPWIRNSKHGKRYNPDPFYQSTLWKRTKALFKKGFTPSPRGPVPNTLCYECYQQGKHVSVHTIDHIVQIKKGGSRTDHDNLRSLCAHHHAIKSAEEGNETKTK